MSVKARVFVLVAAVAIVTCACASGDVGCSVGGGPSFSREMLNGPQLTKEQFADTDIGKVVTFFFQEGGGAVEGGFFRDVQGFSIASKSLVLAYDDMAPSTFITVEHGRVTSWGSCQPTMLSGNLTASRWHPAEDWNRDSTAIPIEVEGGACVTGTRTRVITRIVDVDVIESADRVDVIVWTKERQPLLGCAGVGVDIDSEITLASPLGDRALYDAGLVPHVRVDK
jgi:hypothetical protein